MAKHRTFLFNKRYFTLIKWKKLSVVFIIAHVDGSGRNLFEGTAIVLSTQKKEVIKGKS
jgi:hypothetical protein